MSADSIVCGYFLVRSTNEYAMAQEKIMRLPKGLPAKLYMCQEIFHKTPSYLSQAGYMIPIAFSGKSIALPDTLGEYLDMWEEFISDLQGEELFLCIDQEFGWSSREHFCKQYYQWVMTSYESKDPAKWVFMGNLPEYDGNWKSKFTMDLEENWVCTNPAHQ